MDSLFERYFNNSELKHHMHHISSSCTIAKVIKWGYSVEGQELLALELYAGNTSIENRPAFKYVGNLHGDEPSGR